MQQAEFVVRKAPTEKDLTPGVTTLLDTIRKEPGQTADYYATRLGWQPQTINSYTTPLLWGRLITATDSLNERFHPVIAPPKPRQDANAPQDNQNPTPDTEALKIAICGPDETDPEQN